MKARILAFVALILGMVACQNESDFDNVATEEMHLTVSIDEVATRTESDNGFDLSTLGTEYELRFILEVYNLGNEKHTAQQIAYSTTTSTTFKVELPTNRNYRFVVWADIVEKDERSDLHYKTTDGLTNISLLSEWEPNDETRDAYTAYIDVLGYSGSSNIDALTLARPFAKVRVVSTNASTSTAKMSVNYSSELPTTFNAYNGTVGGNGLKSHDTFDIADYTDVNGSKTLFTDYIFATKESSVLAWTFTTYDNADNVLNSYTFDDTNIKRNTLTTIKGNF